MGKCTIVGKIVVPADIGQAILINGKTCAEQTDWVITGYGGETHELPFTIDNRSGVSFDIKWEITPAADNEYTIGIYESDGVTEVTSPTNIGATTVRNLILRAIFDKYITTDTYNIEIVFDFQ